MHNVTELFQIWYQVWLYMNIYLQIWCEIIYTFNIFENVNIQFL